MSNVAKMELENLGERCAVVDDARISAKREVEALEDSRGILENAFGTPMPFLDGADTEAILQVTLAIKAVRALVSLCETELASIEARKQATIGATRVIVPAPKPIPPGYREIEPTVGPLPDDALWGFFDDREADRLSCWCSKEDADGKLILHSVDEFDIAKGIRVIVPVESANV